MLCLFVIDIAVDACLICFAYACPVNFPVDAKLVDDGADGIHLFCRLKFDSVEIRVRTQDLFFRGSAELPMPRGYYRGTHVQSDR
jgi:hypothetical protein